MNRGYQNLKQLEDATIQAVHALETAIITEGNTASHQLGEVKSELLKAVEREAALRSNWDDRIERDIVRVGDAFTEFRFRGFWSRLNWLVTGR